MKTMVTEDYVSFEVAKLLKEKGFDEPCQFLYFSKYKQEGDFVGNFNARKNSEINEESYSAPTLQMAMKWLRKVHKIYIDTNIRIILGQWSGYNILIYTTDNDGFLDKNIPISLKDNTSYEEAYEAALKYSLENLI